ncbi:siphovirus ReqiPepy6 Gp37-like family protein [Paenibacillus taichungensis]|uniref:siphovirus ReqiPepy6 Gp37-like family protein n=1 Tax=Paenibacillus taichungensis TaxID=484184 RepID=UPI002DB64EF8|nr:siphovirus ReqiPepy6 Gp37-like family protein [Paenibacillus taichungensis]MEC0110400.1 siphovirus ReqiPepy6 Gp37-like family protein [Paenibacillus taichungensis]MEC0200076.1 siphovirus ReqiPepy6 Gp37-like family protein [Paenibacillus taichungensis]
MHIPSVRVIDRDFNLLAEIDDYESLQFTRRFYRAGEFEMHIALHKQGVDQLQKENIIVVDNKMHKAGIIQYREIGQNDQGIEVLVIKGPTLGGILDRRVTVTDNFDRVRGPAETVMKHYVSNHLIISTNTQRRVPFMSNAPDLGRGMETPWQTRFEPLNTVVQEIAEWCDMGWFVRLDYSTRKWVFEVLPGRNLTSDQNTLPPVIFSRDFDNIESQSFMDSDQQFKNVGYAGGQGEYEDRLIQMVGAGTGADRREVFLDCSSAEDAAELVDMGNQKLATQKRIVSYDGRILNTGSFVFEVDWDLGDIVTVQNRAWGVTLNSRITEVKEIYEPESKIEISLGEEVPTITQIIKQLTTEVKRSD